MDNDNAKSADGNPAASTGSGYPIRFDPRLGRPGAILAGAEGGRRPQGVL